MRAFAVFLFCLYLATPARAETVFVATLDGQSNVPPTAAVTATGMATFTLNDAQTELAYHIEYAGLSSDEIASHVHVGNPRENGPVAFALPVGSPKDGVWEITPEHVANLLAGELYVNVPTQAYVSREIRGNIVDDEVSAQEITWGRLKARYRTR